MEGAVKVGVDAVCVCVGACLYVCKAGVGHCELA